MKVCEMNNSWI